MDLILLFTSCAALIVFRYLFLSDLIKEFVERKLVKHSEDSKFSDPDWNPLEEMLNCQKGGEVDEKKFIEWLEKIADEAENWEIGNTNSDSLFVRYNYKFGPVSLKLRPWAGGSSLGMEINGEKTNERMGRGRRFFSFIS